MPYQLGRFQAHAERIEDERKLAKLLETSEEEAPKLARGGATAGGDARRPRGIPAIGPGCSPRKRPSWCRARERAAHLKDGNPTPAIEAPVLVSCGECGGAYELSARNARVHRNNGTTPRCRDCRYGSPQPVVTEAMRRWWTTRYTTEQIVELAAGLAL